MMFGHEMLLSRLAKDIGCGRAGTENGPGLKRHLPDDIGEYPHMYFIVMTHGEMCRQSPKSIIDI